VVLGKAWGLPGVAAGCLLSALLLAVPLGVRYLCQVSGLTVGQLWRRVFASWAVRGVVMLAVGAVAGHWLAPRALWLLALCAPLMGLLYLWHMRPLYVGLPLPAKVRLMLVRARLVPQQ
jgi:hypothetical protein